MIINNQINTMDNINIDLSIFEKQYCFNSSEFFLSLFYPRIKSITIDNPRKTITYRINLHEPFLNPVNKIHGGAIGMIIENLSNSTIYYFTNKQYCTLDMNINFVNSIDIKMDFDVIVRCVKSDGMTTFLDVELKDKEKIFSNSSVIKSMVSAKF